VFIDTYDKLIIGTGASAIVPPWDKVDLKNIFKLSVYEDSIKIKEVIDETLGAMKRDIEKKHLKLVVDVVPSKMDLDKIKVERVISNIVNNALNYTDKGKIEIKGYIKGNNYYIEVMDTGIGIKSGDLDKIFKRFYRVDKTRSRETGGSGLGLSISKNVIKKHGGEITVESEINNGTTFIVKLPIKR
jgi:signal transduction histidine kinase